MEKPKKPRLGSLYKQDHGYGAQPEVIMDTELSQKSGLPGGGGRV